jgi:hypothetical protein
MYNLYSGMAEERVGEIASYIGIGEFPDVMRPAGV